jgi:hypothetical protein
VGLRVAKSFTISKIKCSVGPLTAHRFVSKLFAAVENTKKLRADAKND